VKAVGIHHVNLMFEDIEVAREFYGETLGFEELPRPDFGFPGLWFQMGAHQLHMQPGSAPDSFQHFALQVDDLDAVLEDLATRGLVVTASPTVDGAGKQAFFTDPTGNVIELNQPG
jgi:catechol 2,3-dioxygenase-like lactoylglutathione lyase family enzyme